jgi:2-dehydro-3-deoxygalactonokinase
VRSESEWVAVDWGTSNLRAWGIGAAGEVVFSRSSPEGMARLTPDAYPGVLAGLLAGATPPDKRPREILVCGMAGARQGWLEAPYLDTPADLGRLLAGAVRPSLPETGFDVRILPGVCQRTAGGEDVMRGEETQLLGLLALRPGFSGTVCMPGTHSKWARLDGGRIETFATAMTGELFEAVSAHTVVRHALAGEQSGPEAEAGISAGLAAGLETPALLTSLLFRTRAASLLSGKGPDWCAGYLSGLLVGAEVGGRREWIGEDIVPIIGSPRLCQIYTAALTQAGARTETIDATDATIAGLIAARSQGPT